MALAWDKNTVLEIELRDDLSAVTPVREISVCDLIRKYIADKPSFAYLSESQAVDIFYSRSVQETPSN